MKCTQCGHDNPELKIAGKPVPVIVCNSCGEMLGSDSLANRTEQLALLCNSFSPVFLQANQRYTIGRERVNEIALSDNLVSRKHATIEVGPDEEVTIEDHGSSNGTFLNGLEIRSKTLLRIEDKISIGSHNIFFKKLHPSKKETVSQVQDNETVQITDLRFPLTTPNGMMGSLSHITIQEVLNVLEGTGKTGELEIVYETLKGKMILRNGKIIQCVFGKLKNLEAIFELLKFNRGAFEFIVKEDFAELEDEVPFNLMQILLEFARRYDEKIGMATTQRFRTKQ